MTEDSDEDGRIQDLVVELFSFFLCVGCVIFIPFFISMLLIKTCEYLYLIYNQESHSLFAIVFL
jgi:hypothetical protein